MNVNATGAELIIVGSQTYPQGIVLTQAPGEVDFLAMEEVVIGNMVIGLNGHAENWGTPGTFTFVIALIPGSDNDDDMSFLFSSNHIQGGSQGANDVITASMSYPSSPLPTAYSEGQYMKYTPQSVPSSSFRLKPKLYTITFARKFGPGK